MFKILRDISSAFLMLILILPACEENYEFPYDDAISKVTDKELEVYLGSICLELGGHICLTAVGTCSQCGGMTPCCNMAICSGCAKERGVCPFCLKKLDWTKNTDSDQDIPVLLKMLTQGGTKAKRIAVFALGQIRRKNTVGYIVREAHNKELHEIMANALGQIGDERTIGVVQNILKSGNDMALRSAAHALSRFKSRKAINILLDCAKGKKGWNIWAQYHAIDALGSIKESQAVVPMIERLKEITAKKSPDRGDEDNIGVAIINALASIGDPMALPIFFEIARRSHAEEDWVYYGLTESTLLQSISGGPVTPFERLLAVLSCEELRKELKKCLELKDERTYAYIIRVLGKKKDENSVELILRALDTFPNSQYSAIEALGEIGDVRAFDRLVEIFENGKGEFRPYAARALGKLGDMRAVPILKKYISKGDNYLQGAIMYVLETLTGTSPRLEEEKRKQKTFEDWGRFINEKKIATKEDIPTILNVIKYIQYDTWTKAKAIEYLGQIGVKNEKILKVLRDHLKKDPSVAIASAHALWKLKIKEGVPILIKYLEHRELYIRKPAFEALKSIAKRSFGYDPEAADSLRAKATLKWKKWWGIK